MVDAKSQITSVLYIRLDTAFNVYGQPMSFKTSKTSSVEDMIEFVEHRHKDLKQIDIGTIEILRLKTPVPAPRPKTVSQLHAVAEEGGAENVSSDAPTSVDSLIERLIEEGQESDCVEALLGDDLIGDMFVQNLPNIIQAIVLHPPIEPVHTQATATRKKAPEQEVARLRRLREITHRTPPSQCSGQDGVDLHGQVLLGRPAGRYGFPVSLYNEHLARLGYKLSRLDDVGPEADSLFSDASEYIESSRSFFVDTIDDYEGKDHFSTAIMPFFERIFGKGADTTLQIHRVARSEELKKSKPRNTTPDLENAKRDTYAHPDMAVPVQLTGEKNNEAKFLPVIGEFKKHDGEGNTTEQGVKDLAEQIFGSKDEKYFYSTVFPTILIGVCGHVLIISIAICLEYIMLDELLRYALASNCNGTSTIKRFARIASALSECAAGLKEEYKKLLEQNHTPDPKRPFFPQPTIHPSRHGEALPSLEFQGFLDRENGGTIARFPNPTPSDMRSLLLAKMGCHDTVIVKFAARYNEEAHKLLAEKKFAPGLYSCVPVLGGLFMVVMERLQWKLMSDFDPNSIESSAFEDLDSALAELRKKDLVHGDFRDANIMVDPSGTHAKMIDFDWASKEGEGRYPADINKTDLHDQWHPDVIADGLMEMEHDQYAVENVLKPKYMKNAQ